MSTVLILGAFSDVGQALAKKYASMGDTVQLAGRNLAKLETLRSDLSARFETGASVHAFDAMQFDTHKEFLSNLPTVPDITICVFGYLGDQELAQKEFDESRKILDTNFTGAVSILNRVADLYLERGTGVIAGISSVAGERGRMSNYVYGSAKAGFTAYLSGLRNRLSHSGIHVLTVKPGFMKTRMTEDLKLNPALTTLPEAAAASIIKAIKKKKNVLYISWIWRWIMLIIKNIPEPVFKKLKL